MSMKSGKQNGEIVGRTEKKNLEGFRRLWSEAERSAFMALELAQFQVKQW